MRFPFFCERLSYRNVSSKSNLCSWLGDILFAPACGPINVLSERPSSERDVESSCRFEFFCFGFEFVDIPVCPEEFIFEEFGFW